MNYKMLIIIVTIILFFVISYVLDFAMVRILIEYLQIIILPFTPRP